MNRLSLVVLMLLAVVAAGCQPAATLSEQDKAAIAKVTEESVKMINTPKMDHAAYVKQFYTEDAEWLAPNMPPVKGAAAIVQTLQAFPPITDFKAETVSIEGRGDLAFERGNYTMTLNPPGAPPVTDHGKYVEVWKKQADGGWKVAYDSFSSDLPLPGLVLPTATMPAEGNPEAKALAPIVGHWAIDGNMVVDATGTPAAMKGTQGCDWFAGGHSVACRTTFTVKGMTNESVNVMYYDGLRKAYVSAAVGSLKDNSGSAKLEIKPGTFVFTSEFLLEGKPAKDRMTLSNMTAEGGTWKYELSMGGGPYMAAGEGKYLKASLP